MKLIAFYAGKDLDKTIAEAMVKGARRHGIKAEALEGDHPENPPCDVVVLFGVKARMRFEAYRAAGVQTVMIDKGYYRGRIAIAGGKVSKFWRVAVNAHHPTSYLMSLRAPADRWNDLGVEVRPWRTDGHQVVLAGSSGKFHAFNQLIEPTAYATGIVEALRGLSDRPIIYRPKPSWRDAVPIDGAAFSPPKQEIAKVLKGAWAMVTNGSNACFESVLAGIPVIVLGDAVAKPISSTTLGDIVAPRLADDTERQQWLHNLAYCQWTIDEMATGQAFEHAKAQLH